MAIGGDLRAARRARKRSIDDISRTTKIAPAILRALEKDDFDAVPGGLFTRGFLRAYAHDVGLDGEDLVRRRVQHSSVRREAWGPGPLPGDADPAA